MLSQSPKSTNCNYRQREIERPSRSEANCERCNDLCSMKATSGPDTSLANLLMMPILSSGTGRQLNPSTSPFSKAFEEKLVLRRISKVSSDLPQAEQSRCTYKKVETNVMGPMPAPMTPSVVTEDFGFSLSSGLPPTTPIKELCLKVNDRVSKSMKRSDTSIPNIRLKRRRPNEDGIVPTSAMKTKVLPFFPVNW